MRAWQQPVRGRFSFRAYNDEQKLRTPPQRPRAPVGGKSLADVARGITADSCYHCALDTRHDLSCPNYDATDYALCTGIAASWCPNCGDCKCADEDGNRDSMDNPDCPLHNRDSKHASGVDL